MNLGRGRHGPVGPSVHRVSLGAGERDVGTKYKTERFDVGVGSKERVGVPSVRQTVRVGWERMEAEGRKEVRSLVDETRRGGRELVCGCWSCLERKLF